MPSKTVIVPPLGHRWVDPASRKRVWGRRLYKHGGTVVMSFPAEIRKLLEWESGDIVIVEVEGDELRAHRPAVRELKEQQVKT